jgi:hypothetical protein
MGTPDFAIKGATSIHTATITEGNALPVVSLSLSSSSLAEAGGSSVLSATLSRISSENCTVNLSFPSPTQKRVASNLKDYIRSQESISIPAGETIGAINLVSIDDSFVEWNEKIIIEISSTSSLCAESGTQLLTATIIDDDTSSGVVASTENTSSTDTEEGFTVTAINLFTDEVCGSTITDSSGNFDDLVFDLDKARNPNDSNNMKIVIHAVRGKTIIEKYYDGDIISDTSSALSSDSLQNATIASEYPVGKADINTYVSSLMLKKELKALGGAGDAIGLRGFNPKAFDRLTHSFFSDATVSDEGISGGMKIALENINCLMKSERSGGADFGFASWETPLLGLINNDIVDTKRKAYCLEWTK